MTEFIFLNDSSWYCKPSLHLVLRCIFSDPITSSQVRSCMHYNESLVTSCVGFHLVFCHTLHHFHERAAVNTTEWMLFAITKLTSDWERKQMERIRMVTAFKILICFSSQQSEVGIDFLVRFLKSHPTMHVCQISAIFKKNYMICHGNLCF